MERIERALEGLGDERRRASDRCEAAERLEAAQYIRALGAWSVGGDGGAAEEATEAVGEAGLEDKETNGMVAILLISRRQNAESR